MQRWLLGFAIAAVILIGLSPLLRSDEEGEFVFRPVSLPVSASDLAAAMEDDGIWGAQVANVSCERRAPREFFCRGEYTGPPRVPGERIDDVTRAARESVFSGPAAWTVTIDARGYWDADDYDEDLDAR